jgi:hypothetical protein
MPGRQQLLVMAAVLVSLLYLAANHVALGAHAQAAVTHAIGEMLDGALSASRAAR